MSLIRVLLAACLLASAALGARAEEARLGALRMTIEPSRWRLERSDDAELRLSLVSQDKPIIRIGRAKGADAESCAALADFGSAYEQSQASPIQIAGQPALRLLAHSRCRNWVGPAIAYCVAWDGDVYIARTSALGCRSGTPARGADDALRELVGTFRFAP